MRARFLGIRACAKRLYVCKSRQTSGATRNSLQKTQGGPNTCTKAACARADTQKEKCKAKISRSCLGHIGRLSDPGPVFACTRVREPHVARMQIKAFYFSLLLVLLPLQNNLYANYCESARVYRSRARAHMANIPRTAAHTLKHIHG